MWQLDPVDTSRLLAGLDELYAIGPMSTFPARALQVSGALVGCDMASYNEIDLCTGGFKVVAHPLPPDSGALNAAFVRFAHQHPVIDHVRRTGDSKALAISDFVPLRQFHRTGLYGDLFRHVDTEDQLSSTFSAVPGQVILAVAFGRCGSFTDRDRAVLEALRPHLACAYRNATVHEAALKHRATHSAEDSDRVRLSRLTGRQLELLSLIAAGRSNAQAATALDLSVGTVKKHLEHIFSRLEVDSRLAAARIYLGAGSPTCTWWSICSESSSLRVRREEQYLR